MNFVKNVRVAGLLAAFFLAGLYGAPLAHAIYQRLFPEAEYQSGDFSALHAEAGNDIVLFSTSTCPYCKKTRELFAARHLEYKDYVVDQSKEAEALFAKRGGDGAVPLIYIGDREIRGFRESAILDAVASISGSPNPH